MRLQGQLPRGAQALSTAPRFTTKCEHIACGGSPHSLGVRRSWHVKSSSSEPQPVQERASRGGGLTAPPGAGGWRPAKLPESGPEQAAHICSELAFNQEMCQA